MKILFIAGSLNQGGAEFQILKLAKLFKNKGHTIEVLAITNYTFYKYYVDDNKLNYSYLENNYSKIKRIFLSAKKIKQFKPDVIISYLKVVSKLAVFAKIISAQNCVLIVGERTSLIQPFVDKIHFNLMRYSDAITVNSVSKEKYIKKKFKFLLNKTFFFPNILDVSKIDYSYKKPDSNKVINLTYIGRFSPEKNITQMIKAVNVLRQQNKHVRLTLFGDGRNKSYLKEIKKLIIFYDLKDQVFLNGKENDLSKVYPKIDLLILISDFEGFSNVISEALAYGKPIIASKIPENEYLVEDKKNGFLVNHKSSEDIAKGIIKYLDLNDSQREEMSLKNRAKSELIFDKEKLYHQYVELIKKIND